VGDTARQFAVEAAVFAGLRVADSSLADRGAILVAIMSEEA